MSLNLLTGKFKKDLKEKKRTLPEAEVGKQVDDYLSLIGVYFRTIKSDGTKMPNGQWHKSQQGAGISDRIGVVPVSGKFLAIELKAKGKKKSLSEAQYKFLLHIISCDGIGCVADSVEDVKKALASSKQELLDELEKWNPIKTEYSLEHATLLPEWE